MEVEVDVLVVAFHPRDRRSVDEFEGTTLFLREFDAAVTAVRAGDEFDVVVLIAGPDEQPLLLIAVRAALWNPVGRERLDEFRVDRERFVRWRRTELEAVLEVVAGRLARWNWVDAEDFGRAAGRDGVGVVQRPVVAAVRHQSREPEVEQGPRVGGGLEAEMDRHRRRETVVGVDGEGVLGVGSAVVVVVRVVQVRNPVAIGVTGPVGRRAGVGPGVEFVGVGEAVAVLVERRVVRARTGGRPAVVVVRLEDDDAVLARADPVAGVEHGPDSSGE